MDCFKTKLFALGSILKNMVHPNATKSAFFPKNPPLRKCFVCQCGTGRIYFHRPNLFSLAISIFTGRFYFVKKMMYVSVPQKLIFPKNPTLKKGFVSQCGTGVDSIKRLATLEKNNKVVISTTNSNKAF